MKIKIKQSLKEKIRKENEQENNIYNYKWDNAYTALKAWYLVTYFSFEKKRHKNLILDKPSVFAEKLNSGFFDQFFKINCQKSILQNPQKKDLEKIKYISFNHLIKSCPDLIASFYIKK